MNIYFIGTLLSVVTWGATAFLLPAENSVIELGLITMCMLVVISGSIGIYYALSLPTILPLIIFLSTRGSEQMNNLCLIASLFTFFILLSIFMHGKLLISYC